MSHHINKVRTTDLGTEKLCTSCNEWWPADTEFFHADPKGSAGLFYCCKACYFERFRPRRTERSRVKDEGHPTPDPGHRVLAEAMGQPAVQPTNIVFRSGASDPLWAPEDRRFFPVFVGGDF